MKKNILLYVAIFAISVMGLGIAKAADVTSWSEFNTTENIVVKNDIQAEGSPQYIDISGGNAQIIDGGGFSLTGASGYYINTGSKPELTIKNFGSVTDGTEASHTFSYTDTNGNTIYKTVSKSINGFAQTPIQTGNLSKLTVQNVAYKDNVGSSLTLLNVSLKNVDDKATIKDVVFYGNKITSNSYEGALMCLTRGTIEIDNLVFDSNQVGVWAQGLDFFAGTHTNISNSIFQNNKLGVFGALQLSGGEVYIDNSQFINNNCIYGDGGAITVTSKMQNVTNSVFKSNVAAGSGGAIWYSQLASSPYIVNTTFEENTAGDAGGAIYICGTSVSTGSVYIMDSEFKGNEGPYGGGIYSEGVIDLFIIDTDFKNNTAEEGGGIYAGKENLYIFANAKDVIFSGNTATNTESDYNGGAAVYFDARNLSNVAFNINAASGKKVIFDNTIAAYGSGVDVIMNINKSGLSYNDIEGNNVDITNSGEVQFNDKVGDADNNFNINLYGGILSIGQNEDNNASITNPDGLLNDNNFYVKGDSILNTVNSIIGEFAPQTFSIDEDVTLEYQFDVDLANAKSDKLAISENNGSLVLSLFNVISDSTATDLEIKYSDTNVNGTVKDGYTIMTSTQSYEVTAKNDDTGSYVVFSADLPVGGLAAAIIEEADQYVITNGEDENIKKWGADDGNVIKSDIDINGNGNGIYTEKDLPGLVVSEDTNVVLRNVKDLSGFDDALTNNGGTLSIIDSNVTGNSGNADVTNNGGEVNITANNDDVTIGSENTESALTSDGGTVNIDGDKNVTLAGDVQASDGAVINAGANTNTFNGSVNASGDGTKVNINNGETTFNDDVSASEGAEVNVNADNTTFKGDVTASDGSSVNVAADTTFDGKVDASGEGTKVNVNDGETTFNDAVSASEGAEVNVNSDNTTFKGTVTASDGGTVNVSAATTFDGDVSASGEASAVNVDAAATFNGKVSGADGSTMNISADTTFNDSVSDMNINQSSGTVNAKDVSGANYTIEDGTLNLNEGGSFAPEVFESDGGTVNIADESAFSPEANILNGGTISAANAKTGALNLNSLTLSNIVNLSVDVDLKNEIMDTISASDIRGDGKIKVNNFNVLSDTNKPKVKINFANDSIKDRIYTDVTKVSGKIYQYKVSYDDKTGQFTFTGGGGNSKGYSPSVMASSVAAQLGGYLTMLNNYDEAFRNMDMYMLLTSEQRQALKNKNKIASIEGGILYDESLMRQERAEGWVRPYATFERVPLKNGPKVSNVMYGTLMGGESKMYDLGHGWDGIWGAYVGYNGSHQAYNGISIYQNGGTFGFVAMAYKGNFFTGLTINAGANGVEASTKYGDEDFSMLMAGVANKTGYNWELFNGKFIIQPSLLLSYTFVNTFDYHNAADIKIDADPLHAIHIQPQLKFIANLRNGWQPYASVAMIWNILDETNFKANDISLPELSVKPFVKYGIGIRKTWGERFTGYFQTYLTHGGRNGVGLQLGFNWAFGGGKSKRKAHNNAKPVVIKQL